MNNTNENQTSLQEENYLDFCESIDGEQDFKDDYELIYKIGVLYDLYSISSEEIKHTIKTSLDIELAIVDFSVIKRLLEAAFIFANLDSNNYLDGLESNEEIEQKIIDVDKLRNKSYRIAISIYYYGKYLKEEIQNGNKLDDGSFFDNNVVIYRLFTRLGILTKSRDSTLENPTEDIYEMDLQGKIEATQKNISNRFSVQDELIKIHGNEKFEQYYGENFGGYKNDEVYFSDYQKSVMESLFAYKKIGGGTEGNSLAISAPTSAGKTFILKKYIIYKILESYINHEKINIVFVVPSKALINELKGDFLELFKDYGIKKEESEKNICNVHTHVSFDEFIKNNWINESNLFIFTQERLNYFYSDLKSKDDGVSFKINLAIVDEAHKVGYGYRGTLLSYIIGKIKSDNNNLQIVLLAPLLSKLHKFKNEFGLQSLKEKFSHFGLVAKNKIFINRELINRKIYLSFTVNGFKLFNIRVKSIILGNSTNGGAGSQNKYMSYLVANFTKKEDKNIQSIVFRYGPGRVKEQAEELIKSLEVNYNENINSLIDYTGSILPDNFKLNNYLKYCVGYHNGILPISIKSRIETLFKNKELKYLCANSTVLEGVNLPAKNIFIGSDGSNKNISNLDFKNLVGRSGRLNSHLSGNVFFIDYHNYEDKIVDIDGIDYLQNNISEILNDDITMVDTNNKTKFDRFLDYITPGSTKYKAPIRYIDENDRRTKTNELKDFEYILGNMIIQNHDYNIDYNLIGKLIYGIKSYREDKIKLLERFISIIYSDFKLNGLYDNDFFSVLKKNIFTDPRKQFELYDEIIQGSNKFINENIYENVKAIETLSNKHILEECYITYGDIEYKKTINHSINYINKLLEEIQKYFIQKYYFNFPSNSLVKSNSLLNKEDNYYFNTLSYSSGEFMYCNELEKKYTPIIKVNNVSPLLNSWVNSISLKKILGNKNHEVKLKLINNELQFNYLNGMTLYFDIVNVAYKKFLINSSLELDEDNLPQLDTNFIYYMELGTFYPNLVYLISKGVSRESAIWLAGDREKKNGLIKLFPTKGMTEEQYFQYINKDNKLLNELKSQNKIIIKEELEKFIY